MVAYMNGETVGRSIIIGVPTTIGMIIGLFVDHWMIGTVVGAAVGFGIAKFMEKNIHII